MRLKYARSGGWEDSKEKILKRDEALELVYSLYSKNLGTYVAAGVGIDKELEYVKKLARNKKRRVYIFQPDERIFRRLINMFKKYDNVQVIEDYTFNCNKYLPNSSVDYFYALNIVNWKPQRFLTLLKGIYDSLSENGKLVISLYIYCLFDTKNKKDLVDTPEEVFNILNDVAKPLAHYYDDIGILTVYVLSQSETGEIYGRLEKIKKEIDNKIEEYKKKYQSYKMFFS